MPAQRPLLGLLLVAVGVAPVACPGRTVDGEGVEGEGDAVVGEGEGEGDVGEGEGDVGEGEGDAGVVVVRAFRLDPLVRGGTLKVFADVDGDAHCDLDLVGHTFALGDVVDVDGPDLPDAGFFGDEPGTWEVPVTDGVFFDAVAARDGAIDVEGSLRCRALPGGNTATATARSALSIGLSAAPIPTFDVDGDALHTCFDLPMCGDPRLPACACTVEGVAVDADGCGADVALAEAGDRDDVRFVDVACQWLGDGFLYPLRLQRLDVVYGPSLAATPPFLPEQGGTTTLSWAPIGGQQSCDLVDVASGAVVASGVAGAVDVTIEETSSYRLVCRLGVETNFEDVTVAVGLDIVRFDVVRADLAHLEVVWAANGAARCVVSVDDVARDVAAGGLVRVLNGAAVHETSAVVELSCSNDNQTVTRTTTLVSPPEPSSPIVFTPPGPAMADVLALHRPGRWTLRIANADSCDLEQPATGIRLVDLPNIASFPLDEEDGDQPFLLTCRGGGITRSSFFDGAFPHPPARPMTINADLGDGAPACDDGDRACAGSGTVVCDAGDLVVDDCPDATVCANDGVCVVVEGEGEGEGEAGGTGSPALPFAPLTRHLPAGGGVVDVCLSEPIPMFCFVLVFDADRQVLDNRSIVGLHRCLSENGGPVAVTDDVTINVECQGIARPDIRVTVGPTISRFETTPRLSAFEGVERGSTIHVGYETDDVADCTLVHNGVVVATGPDGDLDVVAGAGAAGADGSLLLRCDDDLIAGNSYRVGPTLSVTAHADAGRDVVAEIDRVLVTDCVAELDVGDPIALDESFSHRFAWDYEVDGAAHLVVSCLDSRGDVVSALATVDVPVPLPPRLATLTATPDLLLASGTVSVCVDAVRADACVDGAGNAVDPDGCFDLAVVDDVNVVVSCSNATGSAAGNVVVHVGPTIVSYAFVRTSPQSASLRWDTFAVDSCTLRRSVGANNVDLGVVATDEDDFAVDLVAGGSNRFQLSCAFAGGALTRTLFIAPPPS